MSPVAPAQVVHVGADAPETRQRPVELVAAAANIPVVSVPGLHNV